MDIKETIEGLERVKRDIKVVWLGRDGLVEELEALSHATQILKAYDQAEGELGEKQDIDYEDSSLISGDATINYDLGYNEMHDIATPILVKAKLRIEGLEKENKSLQRNVNEWICNDCNTIFPGYPYTDTRTSMFCPKCKSLRLVKRDSRADVITLKGKISELQQKLEEALLEKEKAIKWADSLTEKNWR